MKYIKRLCLLAAALVLSACTSSEEDESILDFTFNNKTAYLIPAETASCVATVQALNSGAPPSADISSRYFSLMNPVLSWGDASTTGYVALIKIKITSPSIQGGEYTCTISGEELSTLYGTTTELWNFTLEEGTPRTPYKDCPTMKCGSVEVVTDTPFTAVANIDVYGFSRDNATLEEIPVRKKTSIRVENLK
jgi:hypothetical protein